MSKQHLNQTNDNNESANFFLPDFCQTRSLFMILLIGELLAVIFTLLNVDTENSLWNALGFYSMSIQIISLVSTACLCLLRKFFVRFNDWLSGIFSLIIVLVTTFLFSLATIRWFWLLPLDMTDSLQLHLILKNLLIAALIGSVALRYFYLQQQFRTHVALEAAARLEALQARIRPHFLFNSMNVIASLTRIDPKKAERAIEDLSDLFRATLNSNQELIPFSQELENSEKYLAIEKLRLGERLKVERSIQNDTLEVLIPPLSVQPLLENAVYHGIQMLPDGGIVKVESFIDKENLNIIIENPKPTHAAKQGNGIALKNITQRLDVIYKGKGLLIRHSDDHCYQIKMIIPLVKPEY